MLNLVRHLNKINLKQEEYYVQLKTSSEQGGNALLKLS